MDNKERIGKMQSGKYKEILGVEKHVFNRLLRLLEIADVYQRKSTAGRKPRLSVLDKLVITLQYWHSGSGSFEKLYARTTSLNSASLK